MSRSIYLSFAIFVLVFVCSCRAENPSGVEIDGIKHIQNPAEPLKERIELEMEEKFLLDPYEFADVGLRYYFSLRTPDDQIILFDPNQSEADIFTDKGDYVGNMIRHGEGPGEFPPFRMLWVQAIGNRLFVTENRKLAIFDREGRFMTEIKTGDTVVQFLDGSCYLTEKRTRDEKGLLSKFIIRTIDNNAISDGPVLMEGHDVGFITIPQGGGFGDDWGVPKIVHCIDPVKRRFYLCHTPEYQIKAMDEEGKPLFIINKPHERYPLTRKEKEKMLEPFMKSPNPKVFEDLYPNRLMAVKDLVLLPNGYLGVYRISGPKKVDLDVFDPEGRFIYTLVPSEEFEMNHSVFYDFGFSNIETRGDYPIYVEYRITNVTEIFSK